jgi:hypothetical protein
MTAGSQFFRWFGALGLLLVAFAAWSQPGDRILHEPWAANWITGPGKPVNFWTGIVPDELKAYEVLKFRKNFKLEAVPARFKVHVSADNRYKLFINGKLISMGPARGDIFHWNFETIDLAPYLKVGNNTLAALVWNEGPMRPEAQITLATGFILQGDTPAEDIVNTDESWLCKRDESYQPLRARSTGYYVAGPGEIIDMAMNIRGWEQPQFSDATWDKPRVITQGLPKGVFTFAPSAWMLVPSPLPQMELTPQRFSVVRSAVGLKTPALFPRSKTDWVIPANSKGTVILDQGALTNAYPTVEFSGGKGAAFSITYTEALYIHKNENISGNWIPSMPKGNRNEIEGKLFIGRRDSLISDGSANQHFTSLWWRTFRYVKLIVQTREEPLTFHDIYSTFTGFPFVNEAQFEAADPFFKKTLDIGWHTARLCANETYMDCPYYEQLQYVGDTRIQALVSYYNAGDERLARSAIEHLDHSRLAEGLTLSRYPTASTQIIPTFSLWWIGMIHDYWRYRPDDSFVRSMLPGIRQVLTAFEGYQQLDGSLKHVPYWIFTDWVEGFGWKDGVGPIGGDGHSALLDIQLLWAYQLAAELEQNLGLKEQSAHYQGKADQLRTTVKSRYWDTSKGLMADTPERNYFSQHANALAILTGTLTDSESKEVAQKLMRDASLAPASIYFKYYLH